MGLSVIIKIVIWIAIYGFIGNYFNYAIYYFFSVFKSVFFYLHFIFVELLGGSPFFLSILYYAFMFFLSVMVIRFIKLFID